jgi:hypothetical protein
VVIGRVPVRDQAREAALVEPALVEADRERPQWRVDLGRERRERAGVDPA